MNDPRSWTGARWVLLSADDRQVEALRRDGFAEAVARCMVIRDLGASALQRAPELDQLHDPYAMRGMDEAVDRFRRAIRDRERVRILTDYDVDGTTSSLILQATLRLAAPDLAIDYHIPDRFTEIGRASCRERV